MASLKKTITESDELSNAMFPSISFQDMGMSYVAIKSEKDPEEYMMVPAWNIVGYSPNNHGYTLYLNAIDGSMIYEKAH